MLNWTISQAWGQNGFLSVSGFLGSSFHHTKHCLVLLHTTFFFFFLSSIALVMLPRSSCLSVTSHTLALSGILNAISSRKPFYFQNKKVPCFPLNLQYISLISLFQYIRHSIVYVSFPLGNYQIFWVRDQTWLAAFAWCFPQRGHSTNVLNEWMNEWGKGNSIYILTWTVLLCATWWEAFFPIDNYEGLQHDENYRNKS